MFSVASYNHAGINMGSRSSTVLPEKLKLKGEKSRLVSCFVMEISYRRETHLREWMKVSEGDLSQMYFSGQSTRCCLNTITDTFSQNVTDVLAYLPNGKSLLLLAEFVFAVSQLCAYRFRLQRHD